VYYTTADAKGEVKAGMGKKRNGKGQERKDKGGGQK